MSEQIFLDDAALVRLTGFKPKSRQIEWLRQNGIPYWVNGTGHPVVARSSVEGRATAPATAPHQRWTPRVIGA